MSFVDNFFGVLGSAAGSAAAVGFLDLFSDDDPTPSKRTQVSGSGGGGSSALSATMDQAKLAQSRASAGIAHGKATEAFAAHENTKKFVNANIDHTSIRKAIVAELVKKGAPPEMIANVQRTMAASDIAPRQKIPDFNSGFAQQRTV